MAFLTGLRSSTTSGNYTIYDIADIDSATWALVGNTWVNLNYPGPNTGSFVTISCGYQGLVYVFGDGASGTDLYSYNPLANAWTQLANATTGAGEAGFVGINNHLYIIGGENSSSTTVTTVQEYNIATNTWKTKNPMPDAVLTYVVADDTKGLIYRVCGGIIVSGSQQGGPENGYVYDPVSDTWKLIAAFPYANGYNNIAAAFYDKYVFVFGGDDASVGGGQSGVYRYDTVSNTWTQMRNLPSVDTAGCAVAVLNNKIQLIGYNNTTAGYTYDPVNDSYVASSPNLPAIQTNGLNNGPVGFIPIGLGGKL